ncbi:hypothetical protein BaRGS_00031917 [Batillaria attramentaria]|uniref:Uncharacterized protein n=1 Tax=Batillaria attramentaria TaxID=370345 RepID=A0ABD0JQ85_9CAEN
MTQGDTDLQGPSIENRVLPYADLHFDSGHQRQRQAARRIEPYVELIWDSRDQRPKPADQPQRRPHVNPEPLLDADGYLRPSAMVRL